MMTKHTGFTAEQISRHGTPNTKDVELMIIEYAKDKVRIAISKKIKTENEIIYK